MALSYFQFVLLESDAKYVRADAALFLLNLCLMSSSILSASVIQAKTEFPT